MKDFVSRRTICVAALAALSITWGVLVGVLGRPATGPWSVGLIGLLMVSAALWVALRSTPSLTQVIRDIDTEPRLAPVPAPMGSSTVSLKGNKAP